MQINLTRLIDIVMLGLHGVFVHKVRSLLTILGILFGVWSVIAMLAINAGLSKASQQALRKLGSNNIIVNATKPSNGEASKGGGWVAEYGLTKNDVKRLKSISGVQKCAIMHKTLKTANTDIPREAVTVISVEPNYADVANVKLTTGRFISQHDIEHRKNVVIITYTLAQRMFPCQDPIGKTLHLIDTKPNAFKVIGVMKYLPNALKDHATSTNQCVIIPRSTDLSVFGEYLISRDQGSETREKVEINQCILSMKDEDAVLKAAPVVRQMLKQHHDIPDYSVMVPVEKIMLMKKDRQRWNFMFFIIASVSLLVGGIGIMNIMLASVTERTREIGVRRALGGKRKDIVIQFLVESVTLTAIGGLLGIAIGMLVPYLVKEFLHFPTVITNTTLILPFIMAVIVGLVSGLYPAIQAAKLDPIEALRHE